MIGGLRAGIYSAWHGMPSVLGSIRSHAFRSQETGAVISRSDAGSAAFWKVGALASGRTGWDMPTGPTVPSPDVGWPSKSRRLQKKKKKNAKFSLFSHCIDSKMGLFCLVSTGTNDHVCFESQAPPLANQRPLHGGLLGATWPLGRISFPVFCLQTKRG